MADPHTRRPYRRGDAPSIPGGEQRYLEGELKRIEQAETSLFALVPDNTTRTKAQLLALANPAKWQIAFISDPTANKNMVFYDGSAWRYPDGNAV